MHSGATLAAGIGEALAAEILEGKAAELLDPFRPARFQTVG
jgi:glycine/D-amino acid oxidase-like deaminating enzyme